MKLRTGFVSNSSSSSFLVMDMSDFIYDQCVKFNNQSEYPWEITKNTMCVEFDTSMDNMSAEIWIEFLLNLGVNVNSIKSTDFKLIKMDAYKKFVKNDEDS